MELADTLRAWNLVYWYFHEDEIRASLQTERSDASRRTTISPPPRGTSPQAVDSGYPQGRGRGNESAMNQD